MPMCPPPPPDPQCEPALFTGTTFDTSRVYNGVKWKIKRVENAETREHEWALMIHNDLDLLLKGKKPSETQYLPVTRERVDRLEQRSSIGSTSSAILATVVLSHAIMGDASIVTLSSVDTSAVVPLNTDIHFDGHPTVSGDGSIVVFASDRPGSVGGTDLWYAVKRGTSWSTPQRVAGSINTPCDELSPMFAGDSVLVFASAGHSTVGGYDLFAADIIREGSSFGLGSARNLGTPINTPYDELFPVWADARTLYYSSDQPRTGDGERKDFDLFVLSSLTLHEPTPPPARRATITGTVINQQTREPVSDADVTARDAGTREVVASTTTDTAGVYAMDVPVGVPIDVSAQAPDLFFEERRLVVEPASADDTVSIDQPLQIPVTFLLRVNFPTAIFNDPYPHTLDSNGVETTQSWQDALDMLARNVKLSGDRLKRLVLIGHTDDVDTDESNLLLGRNRVNFIMEELVKRGVPREIMEGRSAGESMLPDKRSGEVIDVWRKRARRVELVKVLQH